MRNHFTACNIIALYKSAQLYLTKKKATSSGSKEFCWCSRHCMINQMTNQITKQSKSVISCCCNRQKLLCLELLSQLSKAAASHKDIVSTSTLDTATEPVNSAVDTVKDKSKPKKHTTATQIRAYAGDCPEDLAE